LKPTGRLCKDAMKLHYDFEGIFSSIFSNMLYCRQITSLINAMALTQYKFSI
jgi:hypothetical protein